MTLFAAGNVPFVPNWPVWTFEPVKLSTHGSAVMESHPFGQVGPVRRPDNQEVSILVSFEIPMAPFGNVRAARSGINADNINPGLSQYADP